MKAYGFLIKKFMLVLISILFFSNFFSLNSLASPHFSDISPSSWYYNYVMNIANAGITTGYPNGTYQPNNNVTRAQMAAFIARAMKLNTPQCSSSPFNDVSSSSWYCKYVKALKDSGATSGYPDGTYKPSEIVTRDTMAAFLVKALKLSTHPCTAPPFIDVPIDAWYCPYVQALKDAGITNGYSDGTYKPYAAVTRATMAAFMSKAFLGGGGSQTGKTTPITSANQAKSVASMLYSDSFDIFNSANQDLLPAFSGIYTREINVTSINGFANLLSKFKLPKIPNLNLGYTRSNNINETEQCADGGYIYYSGTSNGNNFYVNMKFDNCSEEGYIDNGDLTIKGYYNSDSDFNITFTVKTLEDIDDSSGSMDEAVISNASFVMKMSNNTETVVFNGNIYGNNSQFSGTAKYNNLTITDIATNLGYSTSVCGIVTYNINPTNYCVGLNGTYKITTIKPIMYDSSSDMDISGEIHINYNVKLVWNTDGTVTVYYGNNIAFNGSEDDLYNICYLP